MSQAIRIIDELGSWDYVGTITPLEGSFVEYPDYTDSVSPTTRLIFQGNMSKVQSYGYLRVRYEVGLISVFSLLRFVRLPFALRFNFIHFPLIF